VVRVNVPRHWDDLLSAVPRATGVSKTSIVRRGIALALIDLDLLDAAALDALPTTRTSAALGRKPA
jgi:hypothetical protein